MMPFKNIKPQKAFLCFSPYPAGHYPGYSDAFDPPIPILFDPPIPTGLTPLMLITFRRV
jgi:hypothetical protein